MTNNNHISNIVTNAFQLVKYAHEHNNEAKGECHPMNADKARTRLVFPKNRNGNTRVSEQELRFAFVEVFNDYVKQHNLDWFYSIETPTERDYGFSGAGQRNALFDLTICDAGFNRIALIEFKAHNPNKDNYDKDTNNLRKNGRMRAKYDKWLVLIPFLCYPAIFLISAEIAVYGGY